MYAVNVLPSQAILCSAPASEAHSILSRVMEGLMEAVSTAKLSNAPEERDSGGGEGRDGLTNQDGTGTAALVSVLTSTVWFVVNVCALQAHTDIACCIPRMVV